MAELFDDSDSLIGQHWQEIARHKHLMVLKPDVERYAALEEAGSLLVLVAVVEDKIVGYSVSFVYPHIHYRDMMFCQNDVLYVHPEHRGGSVGGKLIRETERMAKERGAKMLSWHAKPDSALEAMLDRSTVYHMHETVFMREL